jgi:hypothetical protein
MARAVHVEIEVELQREPIAGTVWSEATPRHPFAGWLELASAIEELRRGASDTGHTTATGPLSTNFSDLG